MRSVAVPLSSTARTFVGLAKLYFEAPEISDSNKALIRATIPYCEMGALENSLAEPRKLMDTCGTIITVLDEIKAMGTTSSKQLHELYRGQYDALMQKVKQGEITRETLKTNLNDIKSSVFDDLRKLFAKIKTSKNMDDAANSQDVTNTIKTVVTKINPVKNSVVTLRKNQEDYLATANPLQKTAISNLPSTKQTTILQTGQKMEPT